MYPSTDLTEGSPSLQENASAPILGRAEVHAFITLHLGPHDGRDPYASPLFTPPTTARCRRR